MHPHSGASALHVIIELDEVNRLAREQETVVLGLDFIRYFHIVLATSQNNEVSWVIEGNERPNQLEKHLRDSTSCPHQLRNT